MDLADLDNTYCCLITTSIHYDPLSTERTNMLATFKIPSVL